MTAASRLLKGLALLLLLVLAVLARLPGRERILDGPRVHLIDPDSHLHAWRMIRAAEAFPALPPWREDRLAHPEGVTLGWPPGLDYLGGALARLAGADPATEEVARVGTLLVVALGALAALVAFGLARRFAPFPWALLGGALLAVWPLHVEYSRVGRIDYHVLEPLLTGLAVLLLLRPREARRWWIAALGAGLCLGLAIWCWTTALFPVTVIGLALLLEALLRPGSRPVLPLAAAAALVVAAPLCLAAPFRGSWALHAPSPLHLTLLGGLLLAGVTAHLLGRRAWYARWPAAVAALLLPLLLIPAREALELALTFGGRGGLWGAILEQRPLYALHPLHAKLLLTYLALPLPLLGLLALRRRGSALLGLLCGALWLLGLWQIRFIPLGLMLGAPLAAVGLHELAMSLRARAERAGARPLLCRAIAPATALAAACLLWPAADYFKGALYLPMGRHLAVEGAARWLRAQGQAAVVMTPLSGGNPMLHVGRVPVVGSALIDPSTEAATRDTLTFFTTRDQPQARRILERRGVTHVLATLQPPGRFGRFLAYLGRPAGRATVVREHRFCMGTRLHLDSASGRWAGKLWLDAVPWLRLRWEGGAEAEPRHFEGVQLFERVRGARVTGRVWPGELVEVSLPLLTNSGRSLLYQDRTIADGRGRFELVVPYPTASRVTARVARYLEEKKKGRNPGVLTLPATISVGPARVRAATGAATVQIPEAAVRTGRAIRVALAPAPP